MCVSQKGRLQYAGIHWGGLSNENKSSFVNMAAKENLLFSATARIAENSSVKTYIVNLP